VWLKLSRGGGGAAVAATRIEARTIGASGPRSLALAGPAIAMTMASTPVAAVHALVRLELIAARPRGAAQPRALWHPIWCGVTQS
jgi:hypothetical protein